MGARFEFAEGLSADGGLGQDRAHSARMYDYYLGGRTNYIVDQEAAHDVMAAFPAIEVAAKANRAYLHRAVRYLARQGVHQFIDVGVGLPSSPSLHEVVRAVTFDTTVVYVDNDPIVLAYAESLLVRDTPGGVTRCVEGDVRRPYELLEAVERTGRIDFGRPVALILHGLLDFIPDDLRPYNIVSRLMERLPPGSYLSVSHCTGDFTPGVWETVIEAYNRHGIRAQARTKTEVLKFFHGLDLVDPGIAVAHRWHPEQGSGPSLARDKHVSVYVGVARKSTAL